MSTATATRSSVKSSPVSVSAPLAAADHAPSDFARQKEEFASLYVRAGMSSAPSYYVAGRALLELLALGVTCKDAAAALPGDASLATKQSRVSNLKRAMTAHPIEPADDASRSAFVALVHGNGPKIRGTKTPPNPIVAALAALDRAIRTCSDAGVPASAVAAAILPVYGASAAAACVDSSDE